MVLLNGESGDVFLVNSSLLSRDGFDGISQNCDVVHCKSGNSSHDWFWDDVCAVTSPTDADFQNGCVDFEIFECMECHKSQVSEIGGEEWNSGSDWLHGGPVFEV